MRYVAPTTACATLRHAMLRCTAVYSAATCSLGCTDRPARMGARHLEAHGARYPTRHGIPRGIWRHGRRVASHIAVSCDLSTAICISIESRDQAGADVPAVSPGGCGTGESSPGADVGGVSPVPAQMWEGEAHDSTALFLDKPHPR